MTIEQREKLNSLLTKVYDVGHRRRIITILNNLAIKPGEKILDCGCKDGFYSYLIASLYDCEITAMDINPLHLNLATKNFKHHKKVHFQIGDVNHLPFKAESFDKIIFTEVLEHVEDEDLALSSLFRVLKKNGTLAITVPNKNYPVMWDTFNGVRRMLRLGHFDKDNKLLAGIWEEHLRLYTLQEFVDALKRNHFIVENVQCLTRYSLPFYYNMVSIARYFYITKKQGHKLKASLDKYDSSSTKGLFFKFFSSIINAIDKLNDKYENNDGPSVCISAKAVKADSK